MPEVWCWYRNVYGWNRSLWSAVRVDAGKHVDFYRGSVLSTAGRSRVTYFYDRQGVRAVPNTGALLFHRVVSVSDGKITECFYDTRIPRA